MEEELTPAEIVIKFIRIYSIQAIISLSLFSLSFFLLAYECTFYLLLWSHPCALYDHWDFVQHSPLKIKKIKRRAKPTFISSLLLFFILLLAGITFLYYKGCNLISLAILAAVEISPIILLLLWIKNRRIENLVKRALEREGRMLTPVEDVLSSGELYRGRGDQAYVELWRLLRRELNKKLL